MTQRKLTPLHPAPHHPITLIKMGSSINKKYIHDLDYWYSNFRAKQLDSYNECHKRIEEIRMLRFGKVDLNEDFVADVDFRNLLLKPIFESCFKFGIWDPEKEKIVRQERECREFINNLDSCTETAKLLKLNFERAPVQAFEVATFVFRKLREGGIHIHSESLDSFTSEGLILNQILDGLVEALIEANIGNDPELKLDERMKFYDYKSEVSALRFYGSVITPQTNLADVKKPSKETLLCLQLIIHVLAFYKLGSSTQTVIPFAEISCLLPKKVLDCCARIALHSLTGRPTRKEIDKLKDNTRNYLVRNPNHSISRTRPEIYDLGYSD